MMVQKNGGSYYTNEMLEEAERAIKQETEWILIENPDIDPNDARKKAEEDNEFVRKALIGGAAVGAAVVSVAGPVGAVAGAGLGLAVGAIAEALKKDGCVIL
ncbi:hypothetical protein ILYODFUR_025549 [Ilyodon furcidens]|uniref:Uncharacterized protein n=1 Tax=Ilyodon furcidens TaxID=33524 RepID=A0ABV0TMQ1_9TELE